SGGVVSNVLLEDGTRIAARTVVSNTNPFHTHTLAGGAAIGAALSARLDALAKDGSTLKVNMALTGLPRFTCLPEDRGQFGPTIHLLPDEGVVMDALRQAHR